MVDINEDREERLRNQIKQSEEIITDEKEIWDDCRDWYKGKQQPDGWDVDDGQYMSVNMIFSNVVSQMPGVSFKVPHYNVSPQATIGLKGSKLIRREMQADVATSVLNYIVRQNDMRKQQQLGILDGLLSIGVWKVYLKSIREPNPRAGQPQLTEEGQPKTDEDGELVEEPDEKVVAQNFLVKRVRPEFFLVDPRTGNDLDTATWVGEKIPMPTRKARDHFSDNSIRPDYILDPDQDPTEQQNEPRMTKVENADHYDEEDIETKLAETIVYEMYDIENDEMLYWANGEVLETRDTPDEYVNTGGHPYAVLKFHEIPNQFYPIPDVYPQIPMNLSYNLTRTRILMYQQSMVPKFLSVRDSFEDEAQVAKLKSDRIGEVLWMDDPADLETALVPAPVPDVQQSDYSTLQIDRSDMARVAGVTNEQVSMPQQDVTATQSAFANQQAQSKNEWKRAKINSAMEDIGEKLLQLVQTRMVRKGVTQIAGPAGEHWVEYSPDQIQGEFNLEVRHGSMQPRDMQTERQEFMEALQIAGSLPGLIQQFNLPRVAEHLVDLIPGLPSSVLLSSQRQDEMNVQTIDGLVERMEKGFDPENAPEPPRMSPMELPGNGQQPGRAGGGRGEAAGMSGANGSMGQRGGQRQAGQNAMDFLQQSMAQAQGGSNV